jgi:dienelactone hydrolase
MINRGRSRAVGLARVLRSASNPVLTQAKRSIVSEDHYIYRPTDGEEIPFSVFISDDMFGEWDITRSIICMPDWHGPTDEMKTLAQEIANKTNWRVFMPDIYGKNRSADTLEEAQAMFDTLDYTQTIEDMGWLAKKLRSWQPGSGIGAVGFSVGGAMALEAAAASEDIYNAASFYGLPAKESWEDLTWALLQSGKPVHLQFGTEDTVVPKEDSDAFEALLQLNRNEHTFFRHQKQGHAFMSSEKYRKQLHQPCTRLAHQTQELAMIRCAHFLLHTTPRFNLDAVHDQEFWLNPYELAPNDPMRTSDWKRY